jgi:hypothetical protein
MEGFKNTTKTQYYSGGGTIKGPKGAAKISKVMGEFKSGDLHSGSKQGPKVSNPKQAVAIALNQARNATGTPPLGASVPQGIKKGGKVVKKAKGGPVKMSLGGVLGDIAGVISPVAALAQGRAPGLLGLLLKKKPTVATPVPATGVGSAPGTAASGPVQPIQPVQPQAKGGRVVKKAKGGSIKKGPGRAAGVVKKLAAIAAAAGAGNAPGAIAGGPMQPPMGAPPMGPPMGQPPGPVMQAKGGSITKKGVPSYSSKPLVGPNKGGLAVKRPGF